MLIGVCHHGIHAFSDWLSSESHIELNIPFYLRSYQLSNVKDVLISFYVGLCCFCYVQNTILLHFERSTEVHTCWNGRFTLQRSFQGTHISKGSVAVNFFTSILLFSSFQSINVIVHP